VTARRRLAARAAAAALPLLLGACAPAAVSRAGASGPAGAAGVPQAADAPDATDGAGGSGTVPEEANGRRNGAAGGAPAATGPARLEDAVRHAEAGERALAAGDAPTALAAFERASSVLGAAAVYGRADPDAFGDVARRVAAGEAAAHLAAGDPYLARLAALRALNSDPADPSLLVLLGTAAYREARFAEADSAFGEAVRRDPSLAAAHAGLGLLDLSANRLASARDRLRRSLDLEETPEVLRLLARIAVLERDYAEAARRLRQAAERDPRLPDARRAQIRERARVYDRLGDGRGSRFRRPVTRGQLRFDLARGDEVPLLPVRVNGRDPVYLILDTGAEDHVLDLAFARELGLELSRPVGSIESTLGGAERRLAVLDSLNLDGIVVERVPVSVADLTVLGLGGRGSYTVGGVLSPALLFRDFLVRVDFARRTIELERYDAGGSGYLSRRPALRRDSVPLRFNADGTGMVVAAEVGASRRHAMLVDTGASDLYLDAGLARALDVDPLDLTVALGDVRRTRLRAHLLRDRAAAGDPGEPRGVALDGVLGYPFFRGLRLVFDWYHGLLLLES
jgi:tetratricopeptide (TPR) repeat protein